MITEKPVLSCVAPNKIELIWPNVERMIEMAVEHSNGEMSAEKIKERLLNKEMLLSTITETDRIVACITYEMRTFDSGKKVMIITTAGGAELYNWIDMVDSFSQGLAKKHDCSEIYIIGRPGWLRTLKNAGFEHVHTILSRKVE